MPRPLKSKTATILQLGYVISSPKLDEGLWLVVDFKYNEQVSTCIFDLLPLDENGDYDENAQPIQVVNYTASIASVARRQFSLTNLDSFEFYEQRIRKTATAKFTSIPPEGLGEFSPLPVQTHEDKLPNHNVLKRMAYWDGPGGKNLTIIDCLEWAETHLEHVNQELPCEQNERALASVKEAISAQRERRQRRIEQNLLGTMEPHK